MATETLALDCWAGLTSEIELEPRTAIVGPSSSDAAALLAATESRGRGISRSWALKHMTFGEWRAAGAHERLDAVRPAPRMSSERKERGFLRGAIARILWGEEAKANWLRERRSRAGLDLRRLLEALDHLTGSLTEGPDSDRESPVGRVLDTLEGRVRAALIDAEARRRDAEATATGDGPRRRPAVDSVREEVERLGAESEATRSLVERHKTLRSQLSSTQSSLRSERAKLGRLTTELKNAERSIGGAKAPPPFDPKGELANRIAALERTVREATDELALARTLYRSYWAERKRRDGLRRELEEHTQDTDAMAQGKESAPPELRTRVESRRRQEERMRREIEAPLEARFDEDRIVELEHLLEERKKELKKARREFEKGAKEWEKRQREYTAISRSVREARREAERIRSEQIATGRRLRTLKDVAERQESALAAMESPSLERSKELSARLEEARQRLARAELEARRYSELEDATRRLSELRASEEAAALGLHALERRRSEEVERELAPLTERAEAFLSEVRPRTSISLSADPDGLTVRLRERGEEIDPRACRVRLLLSDLSVYVAAYGQEGAAISVALDALDPKDREQVMSALSRTGFKLVVVGWTEGGAAKKAKLDGWHVLERTTRRAEELEVMLAHARRARREHEGRLAEGVLAWWRQEMVPLGAASISHVGEDLARAIAEIEESDPDWRERVRVAWRVNDYLPEQFGLRWLTHRSADGSRPNLRAWCQGEFRDEDVRAERERDGSDTRRDDGVPAEGARVAPA